MGRPRGVSFRPLLPPVRASKAKVPRNPDLISLKTAYEEALRRIPNRQDRPRSLQSYELLRQHVVLQGAYNAVRFGGRFLVSRKAIEAAVSVITDNQILEEKEDNKLIQFYDETPDAVDAVRKGIAKTLVHALYVLDHWKANPQNANAQARREATKAIQEGATKQAEKAEAEIVCVTCNRPRNAARDESAQIIFTITNGRDKLSIEDERTLTPWVGHRCPTCWSWKGDAPVDLMRKAIAEQ